MSAPVRVWPRLAGVSKARHYYSEHVLRAALPLFDRAQVYRRFVAYGEPHPLTDFVGQVSDPYWAEDGDLRGVAAIFHPIDGFDEKLTSLCMEATGSSERTEVHDGQRVLVIDRLLSVECFSISEDPADLPESMRLPEGATCEPCRQRIVPARPLA